MAGAIFGVSVGVLFSARAILRSTMALTQGRHVDFTGFVLQLGAILLCFAVGGAILGLADPLRRSPEGRFRYAWLAAAIALGFLLTLAAGPPWRWRFGEVLMWTVAVAIAGIIGGMYLSIRASLATPPTSDTPSGRAPDA